MDKEESKLIGYLNMVIKPASCIGGPKIPMNFINFGGIYSGSGSVCNCALDLNLKRND